jgi:hypothetical protein
MARKIQPIVKRYKLGEEPNDLEYWLSKTPEERLSGLEELRQQYYKIFCNGVRPEFQRVYRIIKLRDKI